MKVIQAITLGHEIYGAQSHVLELSREMKKNGHEVLVVVGTVGALTDKLTEDGIAFQHVTSLVHPINLVQDCKAVFALYRIIQDFKPDLVATHSSKAGIIGRMAAALAKVPRTFTAHGWSFADGIPLPQRKLALFLERLVGRFSDRIIAVADREREFGLKHGVADPDHIVTIHYGTQDNSLYQLSDCPIKVTQTTPVSLTMVAGFRKQKDHPTLFKALAELKDLPWELSLLGDGELQTEMETMVQQLEIADRVTFYGLVDNVEDYLRRTDVMVLTTNWEGLPISIIEALSFGLPVIATAVAGTKEQVIDQYNGITVKRGDVEEVREALRLLITRPDLRAEYGISSRELFLDRFLLSTMYKKTLSVYQEITQ